MQFIAQGKTNWKILLVSVIFSVVVGGLIIWNFRTVLPEKKQYFTEKESVAFGNEQCRKEIIFDLKNTEALKDFQISLKLDTLSLIREGKLSLDCGSIKFIDSDGKTEIPYWIKNS